MGGGGAMRSAAKIAGLNSTLRGTSPADQIAAGARRAAATRPAPEEFSWTGLSQTTNNNNINNSVDLSIQKPSWELDDWEFAGGDEEKLPRIVFGGVPTKEEANEASVELKDALHKIYLSSPDSTGYNEAGNESALSMIPISESLENKVSEGTTNSLPINALKAFRLFNESPAAQSVVVSIASDPSVWHAVMQNEALSEFLQSQKSSAPLLENGSVTKEFVADANQISKSTNGSCDGNGFVDFLDGVKNSVVEMMNSLSDYFQNLFGGPSSVKDNAGANASAKESFSEKAMGASFLGLAVMVIMIVVLKRP